MENFLRVNRMLEENNIKFDTINEHDQFRIVFDKIDDYIVVEDTGEIHARNTSNITLSSAYDFIKHIARKLRALELRVLEIEKNRLEYWLNDLVEQTQGTLHKTFNNPFITYEVKNENGSIELKWRSDNKAIMNNSYGPYGFARKYIDNFMEFIKVIDSIRDESRR